MIRPIVSVVMPVYNVERYVGDAVRSVLAQSHTDFELLIIDDGGQDNSIDVCRAFVDPRIRIITQENRGLAGARNTGIRNARGEFIAFLDSDDIWHREKLARHVAHLRQATDVGVSYSGARLIDDVGRPMGVEQKPRLRNVAPEDIFRRNPISNGSTPVIRRAVFDDIGHASFRPGETNWFDESFRQSEDIECWMRIALLSAWRFEGVSGALTDYRVNEGGLSANITRQFESWLRMRDRVQSIAPRFAAKWGDEAEAYQLRYLARRAVQMRDRGMALDLALSALKRSPRILVDEPVKTVLTIAAAAVLRFSSEDIYGQVERLLLARPKHA